MHSFSAELAEIIQDLTLTGNESDAIVRFDQNVQKNSEELTFCQEDLKSMEGILIPRALA